MKNKNDINGYQLSRDWFDFCFENPDLVKPKHTAIYFFAIEHCNRLGWKKKFGFPSQMAMEAIGIKNWRTYSEAFNDIIDWGFFTLIEKSQNQYSSNIIALAKNTISHTKSLDKALSNHSQKQGASQGRATVSIDKQTNKEQGTNNNIEQSSEISDECDPYPFDDFWDDYDHKKDRKKSEQKWKHLSKADRLKIKEFIPIYLRHQPDAQYRKYPTTFLNSEIWNDDWNAYPPKEKLNGSTNGKAKTDKRDNGITYTRNDIKDFEFDDPAG